MAKQIKKKFIADDAIDGVKLLLEQDQTLRRLLQDGSEQDVIAYLEGLVGAEETRALAAEGVLQSAISAEESARIAAVSAEESARIAGDADLQSKLDVETVRARSADSTLQANIDAEESARIAADSTLQSNIDTEESARIAADNSLQSDISAEESARIAGDSTLQANIDAEESRALAAESALSTRIDDMISNVDPAAIDSFTEVVAAYQAADGNLQTSITNLSTTASNDRAAIRSEFAAADSSLETALQANIDAEESARVAADSALSARVDVLEALEPEEVFTYSSLAQFPSTGESSKVYIAQDSDKIYHWKSVQQPESFDHTVGASGDFPDLATALADASVLDGHKIKVLNGTYDLAAQLVISKQVQIFGESKTGVILQSSADTNAPAILIAVQADNVALVDMTIKHRKTNNTSIETAVGVSGTGWPQARVDGFIMSGCLVEHVEFGLTIRGSNYAVVDSEISYTGPANSTRRAIGLYGNAGQSFVLRNSFLNNSESGNLRAIAMTSTSGSNPNETYEGSLAVEDNIHSGALQQFISMDAFQEGAEKFTLLAKRNITNETSAFISLYSGTANFADLFKKIVVEANEISNLHSSSETGGKGLIGIDGWSSDIDISTLALTVESKDNVLGQLAFRSDYEEMVGSSGSIVGQKSGAITGDVSLSATISATPSEPTYPSLGGSSVEQYAELSEQVDLSELEADLAAEESARIAADSTLQSQIDQINTDVSAVVQFDKESFTITQADLDAGYIDLAAEAKPSSIVMFVDRLAMHEGAAGDVCDYSVSVVGGVTRITFESEMVTPAPEALEVGQVIRVTYAK